MLSVVNRLVIKAQFLSFSRGNKEAKKPQQHSRFGGYKDRQAATFFYDAFPIYQCGLRIPKMHQDTGRNQSIYRIILNIMESLSICDKPDPFFSSFVSIEPLISPNIALDILVKSMFHVPKMLTITRTNL